MKKKSEILRYIALISQLGISMMVPVFLCVGIGVLIDKKYNTFFSIPLLIVGIAAGYKATYMIVKSNMEAARQRPKSEDELEDEEILRKMKESYEENEQYEEKEHIGEDGKNLKKM